MSVCFAYRARMGVAIIAAIAAVIVALIRELSSRLDQQQLRSRLAKDVDILSKLDAASDEYQLLQAHVYRTVQSLVESDAKADRPSEVWLTRLDRMAIPGGLIALAGWFSLTYFDLGRFASLVRSISIVALIPIAVYVLVVAGMVLLLATGATLMVIGLTGKVLQKGKLTRPIGDLLFAAGLKGVRAIRRYTDQFASER